MKLTPEQKAARLAKRNNKRWAASTPEQRRVLIAKDVLQQLKLRMYKPTPGNYINAWRFKDQHYDEQLQPTLLENQQECEACAKGCLFLSRIRLGNEVTRSNLWNMDWKHNADFWPKDNWGLIECAFEGWATCSGGEKARKFHCKYKSYNNRLSAICKNIIANNGLFVL